MELHEDVDVGFYRKVIHIHLKFGMLEQISGNDSELVEHCEHKSR